MIGQRRSDPAVQEHGDRWRAMGWEGARLDIVRKLEEIRGSLLDVAASFFFVFRDDSEPVKARSLRPVFDRDEPDEKLRARVLRAAGAKAAAV